MYRLWFLQLNKVAPGTCSSCSVHSCSMLTGCTTHVKLTRPSKRVAQTYRTLGATVNLRRHCSQLINSFPKQLANVLATTPGQQKSLISDNPTHSLH